jgi:hypothetical protein
MALIELASDSISNCTGLVTCLNRSIEPSELKRLTRDLLGWLQPCNAGLLGQGRETTSETWVFLGMEI